MSSYFAEHKIQAFSIITFLTLFRALSPSLILLQVDREQWKVLDPYNTKAAIIFLPKANRSRELLV